MKKFLLFLAVFSAVCLSCSKEEEPVLTISESSIVAPFEGCSKTITLFANNAWSVSGTSWCTVSPSRGDGGEVPVTITVKENTTYDARECAITFSSLDLVQTLNVSQESNLGIVLPKNKYDVSSEAQQITVEVKANIEYSVLIDAEWIKLNGTKALESNIYVFDIEKNDTYDAREGTITIKEKKGESVEVIKVKQVQLDAILISSKDYNLSSDETTLEIKLQTNVDIEVIVPETASNWVNHVSTKALTDKTLVLNIAKNETYDTRICEVIVKQKNSMLADTIKISQAQKDAIILSQKEYELSSDAHTLEVKLQTNVDVKVEIPEEGKDWISCVETKAMVDHLVILHVKDNKTFEKRECNIYLQNEATTIKDTITVVQQQRDTILLKEKVYNISCEDQMLKIGLKHNINYSVVIPDTVSWISVITTKSLKESELVLEVKENKDVLPRFGTVLISGENKSEFDTIAIIQSGVSRIIYSTKDNSKINIDESSFDAPIQSHTFDNGVGEILFSHQLTAIEKNAFRIRENLTEIELPMGVKMLGEGIFEGCVNLMEVVLPKGIESIPKRAFKGCAYLEHINLPLGVKEIGVDAFMNCIALKSVEIPDGVSLINGGAFENCVQLKSVLLPSSIKKFGGSQVFLGCTSLKEIVIPYGVDAIRYKMFYGCTNLTDISIPESVNKIDAYAFEKCESLVSIQLPNSITSIGLQAFGYCTKLEKMVLPENLELIESQLFLGCTSLSEVVIPGNISEVGSSAFRSCKSLKSVKIPSGVSAIKNMCFFSCESLESIILPEGLVLIEDYAFSNCI